MTDQERETRYLQALLDPLRVCAEYKPRLGHAAKGGVTLAGFQALYGSDAFYAWFGLDDPLMYAAHKAAGGMTSVYRQIGIGCERFFRLILQDELGLTNEQVRWSYNISGSGTKRRTLSLDARIPLDDVRDKVKRERVAGWLSEVSQFLDIAQPIKAALKGVVFEVRQGYKSKDSKRQNADIANAATAYSQAYLPCAAVLSMQFDEDLLLRYRAAHWLILLGVVGAGSRMDSTYHFLREIIGYDLAAFFARNARVLRTEVSRVLQILLKAG